MVQGLTQNRVNRTAIFLVIASLIMGILGPSVCGGTSIDAGRIPDPYELDVQDNHGTHDYVLEDYNDLLDYIQEETHHLSPDARYLLQITPFHMSGIPGSLLRYFSFFVLAQRGASRRSHSFIQYILSQDGDK